MGGTGSSAGGGVVAVGHHLFAEEMDQQEAERAWQSGWTGCSPS
jgi:hypothetical protein